MIPTPAFAVLTEGDGETEEISGGGGGGEGDGGRGVEKDKLRRSELSRKV